MTWTPAMGWRRYRIALALCLPVHFWLCFSFGILGFLASIVAALVIACVLDMERFRPYFEPVTVALELRKQIALSNQIIDAFREQAVTFNRGSPITPWGTYQFDPASVGERRISLLNAEIEQATVKLKHVESRMNKRETSDYMIAMLSEA